MKILLIAMSESLRAVVLEGMADLASTHEVLSLDEDFDALDRLASSERPDVIIMDEVSDMPNYRQILEAFAHKHRDIALIILCANSLSKSEFLMAAMHCGVEDVLPLPLQLEEFRAVLHRIEGKLLPSATPNSGQVLAFVSCKGGSGVTFLASNMAYALAEAASLNVALLDFDLHFGDAALVISDLDPATSLAELAQNMGRLDGALLKASMLQVAPHLFVLAAPSDIEASLLVKAAHVEALLKLASRQYDYVLVDVGDPLSDISIKVLDQADTVVIVMEASLPFIRNCKRLIEAYLALGVAKSKLRLLVNKYDPTDRITLQDIETNLGLKVFKTIALNHETVALAINQGLPISQVASRDKVTEGLLEAVLALTNRAPSKKTGWFQKWLQGPAT